MAAPSLFDRVFVNTATTGTGTVTLGSVVSAQFCSFADVGVPNAAQVRYIIEQGTDFEIGLGTYTVSGTTFSRDTVLLSRIGGTAGTTKLNLGGSATVRIIAAAEDLVLKDASGNVAIAGTLNATSASASALTVGRQGSTQPALQVDASTGSQTSGIKIKGSALNGTAAISVIDTSGNTNLSIDALGSGTITIGGTSTGAITLGQNVTASGTLAVTGTATFNNTSSNGILLSGWSPDGVSANAGALYLGSTSAFQGRIYTGVSTGIQILNIENTQANASSNIVLRTQSSGTPQTVTMKGTGELVISSTTASTSTTTGALTVAGGLGVAGDLFAATLNTSTAPTAISGAGPFAIGSASTLNKRMKVNLGGTDYWIPVSATAY